MGAGRQHGCAEANLPTWQWHAANTAVTKPNRMPTLEAAVVPLIEKGAVPAFAAVAIVVAAGA